MPRSISSAAAQRIDASERTYLPLGADPRRGILCRMAGDRTCTSGDREPTPPRVLLSALRESVERLASSCDAQMVWLQEQELPVDELALDFADAVPQWLPALSAAGLLDDVAIQRVLSLDAALDEISGRGNAELWTEESLRAAGEWNVIRSLARLTGTELERCAGPRTSRT